MKREHLSSHVSLVEYNNFKMNKLNQTHLVTLEALTQYSLSLPLLD